ncbi:cell division protein FtsA [Candidatus Nomurabacteria bacterium RIFCSPLOWO2_01_FULL_33_24]|uniref:Cell division protein FtsA n=1 Tax=Candidatus Nomurabacteria bacterium RIFCSPLOWO2_01_FULL_33_24 TaxID=1801765 RepID=A0A1F6WZ48_9BACT|nr:MAG: cell division protein FtsA [Candidatus Nomurabacteria bacterium RIFCSPLOWO2_01_FULL_33_24]
MSREIAVGVDIGTTTTRVVVVEYVKKNVTPTIIGTATEKTNGLRHGYISNLNEVINSLKLVINIAEKNSGVKIKKAYVSIGGISLKSEISQGISIISKGSEEVVGLDVKNAINDSREKLQLSNRKIVYSDPISFKIDGEEVLGHPEGMQGVKLEVKTLFITCLEQHFNDLVFAVEEAGIEVLDIIPSPIASSLVALSKKQKTVGCLLVNIGAETVSLAVFENEKIISLKVFSIGSTDITNDIALGLKIPLVEAEQIKIGSLLGDYPKKKLDEIIEARLSDIFELIENHLKKIKRNELLPAGVILIGGGSNVSMIEELSKKMLKLPSKIGVLEYQKNKTRDSAWFVAYGLCLVGKKIIEQNLPNKSSNNSFKMMENFFSSIFKQLLP